MGEMKKFSYDYFVEEFNRFWEMCGDKNMPVELLLKAWGGLCYVYINCNGNIEKIGITLKTEHENLVRRLPYFENKMTTPTKEGRR